MGRSAELDELDRLLEAAHGGGSGRLLVAGDPGMGVTAVLAEFAAHVRRRGVGLVEVRAIPAHARRDGSLVADMLLVPTPVPDPGAALQRWFTDLAASGPAIVVLDDLHWADPVSLAAVADAVDLTRHLPLTVVAGGRLVRQVTRAFSRWATLIVGPLGLEDSVALLAERARDDVPTPVLYQLADRLDGNPLALCDVPQLLTSAQVHGRVPLPAHLPVPDALDAAWGDLLSSVPASARRAAVDLAVAGARPDLLARLSEDGDWAQEDLASLADAGMVIPAGRASRDFIHPVVRDVVIGRTPAPVVQHRHQRAAEAAIALGLPPRVVVDHLTHSVAGSDATVADGIEQQARRASDLGEVSVASDAWQAAARMSTSTIDRVTRALAGLRLVIENGLDYAGTDALLDLLAGQQLDAECASWVEWLRTLQRSEADPSTALAAQWTTICRAREAAPGALRGLLWDAAINAWTLGDAAAGLRLAREYADLQRTLPADATIVEPPWTGIALVAAGLFQAGDVHHATAMRRRAIAAAAGMDPETEQFDRLLSAVFLDDLLLDDSREAANRLLVAIQRAEPASAVLACLHGIRAWRARAVGDWATAQELLARGRPLAQMLGAHGPQLGMAALAVELAALQGDDVRLQAEGRTLRANAARVGDRRRLATLDRALGVRALIAGRLDEAVLHLTSAAQSPFLGRGLRDGVLPARVDLAEAHARQGRAPLASRWAEDVMPILNAMDDPLARALALRTRALAGDPADAEHRLRAALAAHDASLDPFERARTHLVLGEHLRRDRRRSEARGELLSAGRLFTALDARPWAARAEAELRACGGDPHTSIGADVLTPQERSIATAVAAGASNREVAEALFLSPRTVEYHLSNAYRKLGVRGRTALARRIGAGSAR